LRLQETINIGFSLIIESSIVYSAKNVDEYIMVVSASDKQGHFPSKQYPVIKIDQIDIIKN